MGRSHRGKFLKVVKAPALAGEDKSRQKGSVEREGVRWVPGTQGARVAATNSLRSRVVENEFREREQTRQTGRPLRANTWIWLSSCRLFAEE